MVYNVHGMNTQSKFPHRPVARANRSSFNITEQTGTGLYFAYGSNLDLRQMVGHRCPNARPLFRARLKNWRLVFRGCADVEPAPGEYVIGGIFQITRLCELALDRYEGYPSLYTKATARVKLEDGTEQQMMFYTMRNQSYESAPGDSYFQTILQGYADFQMPEIEFERITGIAARAEDFEIEFAENNPHLARCQRTGRYRTPTPMIRTACERLPTVYALDSMLARAEAYGIPTDQMSMDDLINQLEEIENAN